MGAARWEVADTCIRAARRVAGHIFKYLSTYVSNECRTGKRRGAQRIRANPRKVLRPIPSIYRYNRTSNVVTVG